MLIRNFIRRRLEFKDFKVNASGGSSSQGPMRFKITEKK